MMRRLVRMVAAALLVSVGLIVAMGRLGRDWEARVAVRGHSMAPTLLEGDWLLVSPTAYERRAPRPGELVVARDQSAGGRLLIKRVVDAPIDAGLVLVGDNPAHAYDLIGPISLADVAGRPWLRYWPPERFGRIGDGGA